VSSPTIDELLLADEPERWSGLGFTVLDDAVGLGAVTLRLAGADAGRGILGWSLRAISSTELDGLPTTHSQTPQPQLAPPHPNGIVRIDHIVAMSPALDRSVRSLQQAGLDLRRIREQPTPAGAPRQAFFRLGAEILEVIQIPDEALAKAGGPDAPARLWGLALVAPDLDETVAAFGAHVGTPRDAVQAGRRIATVRREAGLAVPVALMTPR
jgi:hypothetical protein